MDRISSMSPVPTSIRDHVPCIRYACITFCVDLHFSATASAWPSRRLKFEICFAHCAQNNTVVTTFTSLSTFVTNIGGRIVSFNYLASTFTLCSRALAHPLSLLPALSLQHLQTEQQTRLRPATRQTRQTRQTLPTLPTLPPTQQRVHQRQQHIQQLHLQLQVAVDQMARLRRVRQAVSLVQATATSPQLYRCRSTPLWSVYVV